MISFLDQVAAFPNGKHVKCAEIHAHSTSSKEHATQSILFPYQQHVHRLGDNLHLVSLFDAQIV